MRIVIRDVAVNVVDGPTREVGRYEGVRATVVAMPTIDVDDALLAVLPDGPSSAAEQLHELAVVELYRRRVISSGKAAELLHRDRADFIVYANILGIPYLDLDELELRRDVETSATLKR